MIVAEARGASFTWDLFSGGSIAGSIATPVDPFHAWDAWDVLEEVAGWLGFSISPNINPYLNALELEKGAIFNRAQY